MFHICAEYYSTVYGCHRVKCYKKRFYSLIFYSLGNFMFDMYYGHEIEWTRKSFVARLVFDGKEFARIEVHPVALTLNYPNKPDHELLVLRGEERRHVLNHLRELSLELLDDEKIEEANGEFIPPKFIGLLRRCYRNGQQGDREAFDLFINSIIYRDPYLKLCRDFVKYQLRGEDVGDF